MQKDDPRDTRLLLGAGVTSVLVLVYDGRIPPTLLRRRDAAATTKFVGRADDSLRPVQSCRASEVGAKCMRAAGRTHPPSSRRHKSFRGPFVTN